MPLIFCCFRGLITSEGIPFGVLRVSAVENMPISHWKERRNKKESEREMANEKGDGKGKGVHGIELHCGAQAMSYVFVVFAQSERYWLFRSCELL